MLLYYQNNIIIFYDDFLKWCLYNNNLIFKFDKTEQNFTNLYKFIESKYNKKSTYDINK